MDQFKIQHFKNDTSELFPPFEALAPQKCNDICRQLQDALGLPAETDPFVIVTELAKRQTICDATNAAHEGFNLQDLFSAVGINPREDVFVNWYRFDDIDRLKFTDLSKHFSDIWYPSSDDIDVFDASLAWVVSICHEGYVSCLKFSN